MRLSVESYLRAPVERAMKVQEVILPALAKITWWQPAEIIGISDRQMRRWRERYEEHGYDGLIDRRRGRPSEKRVPVAQVEQVLGLYRENYFDLNVRDHSCMDRLVPLDFSPAIAVSLNIVCIVASHNVSWTMTSERSIMTWSRMPGRCAS